MNNEVPQDKPNGVLEFSLEQQFLICQFDVQVDSITSLDSAKYRLKELYRMMLMKENGYRLFIKNNGGI